MILFGTGGIRGIMKEGEFDEKTIMVATKGVSNYMKDNNLKSVVIAYDTRNNSRKFAELTAKVFAADQHKVLLFSEPVPTPVLSFAVRYLKADIGIVITASHNPPEYNGYKVYTSNGVQAIPQVTNILSKYVEHAWNLPIHLSDNFKLIDDKILNKFVEIVCETVNTDLTGLEIVYTPLHGTGAKPVIKVLEKLGAKVIKVEEQMEPNGNFPTVKSPNPEDDEALELLKLYMKKFKVSLGIATDPDCDRVGVIWKDTRLTGNQVGVILTNLLLEKAQHNSMVIKTIVTTDMVKPMCSEKNVKVYETPTGFKFIGDLIEKSKLSFLFGFEESCGYLTGNHARDKDGVIGSALVAVSAKNNDLIETLEELYAKYGYYYEKLLNFKFKDIKIAKELYEKIKNGTLPKSAKKIIDYSKGIDGILPNETLKIVFDEGKIYVRPSGTEPKLKAYVMTNSKIKEEAERNIEKLSNYFFSFIESMI
ncbi:phospho-sugar mutase [Thermosipho atlanticus]|uniref:Phosphomannomutase n=1 Tax=Thermosipho atlanticus DSM 15807 TaxID=1123380 RepID=A0A1M5QM46_9BACT|nr:phospho-sugar mutase [Thermosipho atlanticus]SHH15197.1 phosphomannomutase [Thermosipho atlanticus DSM 15807]